jgi:hypothetical protein
MKIDFQDLQKGSSPEKMDDQRKVILSPIPWEEECLSHKPRCSGNLLSLWAGLAHGAMSKASKYSSGWVTMADAELAPSGKLKWELWQCLNAMALD